MATVFVNNVTEPEQALELAHFINKLRTKGKEPNEAFYEECQKLSEANQHLPLLIKLVEETPLVISEGTEKEVDGFLYVTLSLAKKLGLEAIHKIVPKLTSVVTSNREDKPLLRIKFLNNLYNIIDISPSDRHQVFIETIKFAESTGNREAILSQLKDKEIEQRFEEWGITLKQKREAYKFIRDIVRSSNKRLHVHKWTVKYLSTFEGATEEEQNAVTEDAVKSALEAITLPELYQFDELLNLSVIKRLEKDKNQTNSMVYHLLKIFVGETLDAFKALTDHHPELLKTVGLNYEDCLRKIRVLSLATLGASNSEIPYSLIAKTLQINENDVEVWVITAISENLIAAKMDQLKRIVVITRSLQRVFTKSQWKQLSESLNTWKSNVKMMMDTLQQTKHQSPHQQQATLMKAIQS